MSLNEIDPKLPWDAPATEPLTEAESRADQPDVAVRNLSTGPSSLPG